MRYPLHEQETIAESMLIVLLNRPYKDSNEHDLKALKALIPLLDTRQCWMVMEWLGP